LIADASLVRVLMFAATHCRSVSQSRGAVKSNPPSCPIPLPVEPLSNTHKIVEIAKEYHHEATAILPRTGRCS